MPEDKALMQKLSLFGRMTERLALREAPYTRFALLALVAMFIYEIGQSAIRVFLEQFGLRSGLGKFRIG